jgi:hypothetical protein
VFESAGIFIFGGINYMFKVCLRENNYNLLLNIYSIASSFRESATILVSKVIS